MENATVFQFLLYKQRMRHMEAMWRKCYVKAKAAGQFAKFVRDMQDKIYLLGINFNIRDKKETIMVPFCIIPPESRFSNIWALVIAILLLYTATYMPYKTCFVDTSTTIDDVIDWTVDVLFMCDIICQNPAPLILFKCNILVNFLQATENSDGTWVVQPKIIAKNYIRSWFAFDLISVLPFQLIEKFFEKDGESGDSASYNQLIRLLRLPRLYRLSKLMRLFKLIKTAKKVKWIQRLVKRFKTNSAI